MRSSFKDGQTRRSVLSGCACSLTMLLPTPLCADSDRGCLTASIEEEGQSSPASAQSANARIVSVIGSRLLSVLGEAAPTFDYEFKLGRFSPSASPDCLNTRATIRFPANLVSELGSGEAVTYVLGHEIAHVAQYVASSNLKRQICQGRSVDVRTYELMADAISGWCYRILFPGATSDIVLSTISKLSDYEFSNAAHHGTVTERISAFNLGTSASDKRMRLSVVNLVNNIALFEEAIFPSRQIESFNSAQDKRDYYLRRLFVSPRS
ncbi:hypothetical protein AEGHOMDF_3511 [Methylobacterium soli]|nr:hypothetical protein AEGHOMDF_3511 [Methylobacterium soli]